MVEGKRVRLRAPESQDAEAMLSTLSDYGTMKRFSRDLFAPITLQYHRDNLTKVWKEWSKDYNFSIEEKSHNR